MELMRVRPQRCGKWERAVRVSARKLTGSVMLQCEVKFEDLPECGQLVNFGATKYRFDLIDY